jgi:hypothetical protein
MFTRDVKLGDKLKPFKKSKQKIPRTSAASHSNILTKTCTHHSVFVCARRPLFLNKHRINNGISARSLITTHLNSGSCRYSRVSTSLFVYTLSVPRAFLSLTAAENSPHGIGAAPVA